jgi:type I restriction enzyme, S subunit
MKNSGIPWIGEIPKNWNLKRVKYVTKVIYGDSLPDQNRVDGKIPVYGSNGIVGHHNESITTSETIIIGRKGSVGELNFSHKPCFPIDTTYFVDKNSTCHNLQWLFYMLKCLRLTELNKDSAVPGISREDIYNLKIPFHFEEQKQIADYLDKKTQKIDGEIFKNQKLIALLKEQRQSTINHVVVKGLDDTVPMKNSGILGIKQIPENWIEVNLGLVSTLYVPMRDKPKKFDGDIPWLRIEDIQGRYASDSLSKQYVSKDIVREMNLKIYPTGTVLCSCSATIGFYAITKNELITNQTFIGIYPNQKLYNEFLFYFLNTQTENIRLLGVGATILYISREKFEKLKILLPPTKEQKQIVSYLDEKTRKIDELISKVELQIKQLQEFRASLISSVVTGKIQVAQA